jgi:beta propeller repeat protein
MFFGFASAQFNYWGFINSFTLEDYLREKGSFNLRKVIASIIAAGMFITGCNEPSVQQAEISIPPIAYVAEGTGTALDGDTLLIEGNNSLKVVNLKKKQEVLEIHIPSKYGSLGFDIFNNIVVWSDLRNEKRDIEQLGEFEKANADIFLYNLKTGEQKQITKNSSVQMNPKIWGNYIVWQDNRNDFSKDYPGRWNLYMYDLTTGKEQTITSTLSAHATYGIDDFRIVWEDDRNNKASDMIRGGDNVPENNKDIYGFDIRMQQEFAIATGALMESKPYIFKDYVVWEDRNGGKMYNASIVLYNLDTKRKREIIDDEFNRANPKVNEDFVVWMDERRGTSANDVYFNGQAPNSDIFMFNLKTNSERQLTGDGPQVLPNISSSWISFVLSKQVGPQVQVVRIGD